MSDELPSGEQVKEALDELAAQMALIKWQVQHPTEQMRLWSDLMDVVQRLSRDQLVRLIAYAQDMSDD